MGTTSSSFAPSSWIHNGHSVSTTSLWAARAKIGKAKVETAKPTKVKAKVVTTKPTKGKAKASPAVSGKKAPAVKKAAKGKVAPAKAAPAKAAPAKAGFSLPSFGGGAKKSPA